jgi:hypothetical protein
LWNPLDERKVYNGGEAGVPKFSTVQFQLKNPLPPSFLSSAGLILLLNKCPPSGGSSKTG